MSTGGNGDGASETTSGSDDDESSSSVPVYQINPHHAPETLDVDGDEMRLFKFTGQWLGKALLDGHSVPFAWADPIYEALLLQGCPVTSPMTRLDSDDSPTSSRSMHSVPPQPVLHPASKTTTTKEGGRGDEEGGGTISTLAASSSPPSPTAATLERLLSDLAHYDAEMHKQLSSLLTMPPEEVEALCLDFTVAYDTRRRQKISSGDGIGGGENLESGGSGAAADTDTDTAADTVAVAAQLAVAGETTAAGRRVVVTVELEEGGSSREVNGACVHEYVEKRCKRRVVADVGPQLKMLAAGFHEVVPVEETAGLTAKDLKHLLCGTPGVVNVKDWREHTVYLGVFKPSTLKQPHKIVRWFWAWVESLDAAQRRRLLRFVTGSSGVPVGGFSQLQGNDGNICRFTLQPLPPQGGGGTGTGGGGGGGGARSDERPLPRAHTCFNRLDLPLYGSKAELEQVLSAVISFDVALAGFGMD